jgi:hypothetical protein
MEEAQSCVSEVNEPLCMDTKWLAVSIVTFCSICRIGLTKTLKSNVVSHNQLHMTFGCNFAKHLCGITFNHSV